MDPVTYPVVAAPCVHGRCEMLHDMAKREQIVVSDNAKAELKKLMADAGEQKPRIYIAGFG